MDRRVNRPLLDQWLAKHGPDGISKLAVESKVSASTIARARTSRKAPKKLSTLERLSEAMGHQLDDIFPEDGKKGNKAS